MGKVTTDILLKNHIDVMTGVVPPRQIEIKNAIVDSGATMLSLSSDTIAKLGLTKTRRSKVNTASGIDELDIYGTVNLSIMGREGAFEVMELKHPTIKALVGQQPLEIFDFLIHPGINRIIPNPEHDGQLVLDLLLTDDLFKYRENL